MDKNGNVLQERNPAQLITNLAYDPMNRLIKSTDPMGFSCHPRRNDGAKKTRNRCSNSRPSPTPFTH